jgi:RNA polymerase sigma-70 factor (ECF subfamily)
MPMLGEDLENELIAQAVAGDGLALEKLLLAYYDRLVAFMATQLPAKMRGAFSARDIVQETLVQAFKDIQNFESRGPGSVENWLFAIAKHRLLDQIKAEHAKKRSSGRQIIVNAANLGDNSGADLLEALHWHEDTPSQSAMRHEAEQTVLVALAGLPEHYRQALHLRYFEKLSVEAVAAKMGRSIRAVHMLCNRARKRLRRALRPLPD